MSLRLPTTDVRAIDRPYPEARPFTISDCADSCRLDALRKLTGLPLLLVDSSTGSVLDRTEDLPPYVPPCMRTRLRGLSRPLVMRSPDGLQVFAAPLSARDGSSTASQTATRTAAVGFMAFETVGPPPSDLMLAAIEHGWSTDRLNRFLSGNPAGPSARIERLLTLALGQLALDDDAQRSDRNGGGGHCVTSEFDLFRRLSRQLEISNRSPDAARKCLGRLHELLGPQGSLLWLESRDGAPECFTWGELPFDEVGVARLLSRFEDRDWRRPLVETRIDGTRLGAAFPGLRSFAACPIAGTERRHGWILCANLPDRGFDGVHADLLQSAADVLGTHASNVDLFCRQEELLFSFVRSLVSTLDAKDPYTRGHSERVALIGRRLGEQLGLNDEELADLYLSGMLHDVGKIGVDDGILRKPGKLTDAEFEQIKQHPVIGYEILKGLKNLKKILPGVRNHHEAFDGTGYPDRLCGRDIPQMARILAVADAYDAMQHDRPYRAGMPTHRVAAILQKGSGVQWDPDAVAAYFAVSEDVESICRNHAAGRFPVDAFDSSIYQKPQPGSNT